MDRIKEIAEIIERRSGVEELTLDNQKLIKKDGTELIRDRKLTCVASLSRHINDYPGDLESDIDTVLKHMQVDTKPRGFYLKNKAESLYEIHIYW